MINATLTKIIVSPSHRSHIRATMQHPNSSQTASFRDISLKDRLRLAVVSSFFNYSNVL